MSTDGVTKEDARLTPGEAVGEECEPLAGEGVKGVGDGKNLFPIQVVWRS
jgi:hypothetical protein